MNIFKITVLNFCFALQTPYETLEKLGMKFQTNLS